MSEPGEDGPPGAGVAAEPHRGSAPGSSALADGEWHRLHPMTPLLRGGLVLVAIIGIIVVNLRDVWLDLVVEAVFGPEAPSAPGADDPELVLRILDSPWLAAALGGGALLLALIVVGFWLSWRMHSFRVTDELVEVRSGILFRTHRRGRLDRIQGINIVRPFLARLIGAAKLDVQVAGQDGTVALAYLGSRQADALRADILRAAARARDDGTGSSGPGGGTAAVGAGVAAEPRWGSALSSSALLAPELDPALAAPESVVRMSPLRLAGSILLSMTTIILLALVAAAIVGATLSRQWVFLFTIVPVIIGLGGFTIQRFTKSLRYSIAGTPDGIRVGFGLLSTANETIPPGRIHAVHIHQPLMWRPFGWWSMTIARATAQAMDSSGQRPSSSLLPVGDLADVHRVLDLVLPGFEARDGAVLRAGIVGSGEAEGFTISPPRARLVRWFSRRRNGIAAGTGVVLLRTGAIWRQVTVVPLARVQSTALWRGPLARAQRLAAIEVHTVGGVISPSVGALDAGDAAAWFARIAGAATEALREERWGDAPVGERAEGESEGSPESTEGVPQ